MSPQLWLFRKVDFFRISLFAINNMQRDWLIADDRKGFLRFAFYRSQILYLSFGVVKIKLFAHHQIIRCNTLSIILRLPTESSRIIFKLNNQNNRKFLMQYRVIIFVLGIIYTPIQMQLDEFKYIYEDMKAQLKEIPSLPLLLKSIEKTTKKLDCLNLYSLIDRREFDLELYEKDIYDEITQLLHQVSQISQEINQQSIDEDRIVQLQQKIQQIKQSKMEAFDKLNKQEESLQEQLTRLVDEQMFVKPTNVEDEIKEVEQDEEEMPEETGIGQQNRIESLKKEIDELNTKIIRINRGKGKWFDGDHNDFVKLYNRCGGDGKKVIEQGVKILGMKNIQIMDHLQVYETYLQLQKEKKLVTEQFKSIKMFEQQLKNEEEIKQQMSKQEKEKARKRQKEEENMQKKIQVEEFKRKKVEQRQKLVQQLMREKDNEKKTIKLSVEKKNEIQNRNKRLIEQKQEQFKIRTSASGSASKNKPKPQTNIVIPNQVHTLKQIPKLPKAPIIPKK